MANHSQRRLILSLRQPFHFYRTLNSSLFRSSSQLTHLINPNFRSSSSAPFSSSSKFAIPFNQSQLIRNSAFNGTRSFATRLSDLSSGSNRPPKETIMLEGCDFEHWLVVVEPPHPKLTRDEIIEGYVKTLSQILKSEEEARMKIYSVSTRCYFAFSALISEEQSFRLKELPNVRWILPDSYMDVKNKTYAGEPFINGQAVPYDPKYHETWVRNNEESQRNNSKSRRRQRDPNSRSRSPTSTSASSSSNQNSMSASGPQQHHAPHTSSPQNQTSQSSSLSDPVSQRQNLMGCPGSQNDAAQSFRTQNPSHIQNQALNQAPAFSQNQNPPSFSHNQPPQPSHMQDHTNPWNTPSQPPATNRYSQGSHNHSWAPPRGHDIQTRHPSNMQNQPPSMSSTFNPYDPARNVQNESWENSTMHQNQSAHTSISNNNSSYDNVPHSGSSIKLPNQGRNWVPASGSQSQPPQHPVSNNFSKANAPPSAPAGGMPTHMQNTNFQRGSMQPQGQQNGFSYGDIPHQSQSPQHPLSNNISNTNAPSSAPDRGMPTYTQNTNFHEGSMQPQGQRNGFSYGDTPHQYGGFSNGYPSQPLQQQQYQESNNAYRDMQSSKTTVTSPNVQNYHNSRRWGMPNEIQLNNNSRNVPHHVQSSTAHTGYPPEPPYQSFDKEYQNSGHLQSSNVSASPQGWNYQSMNPPMQNNEFQHNVPMSHGVDSHQFHGKDMPRPMQNNEFHRNADPTAQNVNHGGRKPMQNNEFQHNTGPTAQNVNHGGRMPMQNNEFQHNMGPTAQNVNHGERMPKDTSLETFQTRDYQERDLPIDTYMYATKR